MYVLFEDGSDYASGYSSVIPAFHVGIKLDDISMLQKEIEVEYFVDETVGGVKWYVDKFGMPTTDTKNIQPLEKKVKTKEIIDFAHYPNKFTKVDVMRHKQHLLLNESKYDDCMMYEYNLFEFIDADKSDVIQVNDSKIDIYKNGFAKTKAIKIENIKEFSVIVDSEDKIDVYYSLNGNNYAKAKKDNKIVDEGINEIYLGFKTKDEHSVINAYHILYKKAVE